VPAAAAPQSYTRAARPDRVAPAAHYRLRPNGFAPSPAQRSFRMSDDLSGILETTRAPGHRRATAARPREHQL